MYVPLWLIVVTALAFLVLLRLALRPRAGGVPGGDMIERQRRAVPPSPLPNAEAAALLARPDVAAALAKGNKIAAIKLVREAGGLGLKEAKDLVERGGH